MTEPLELRHPPAFAGGRLLWWNRMLRATRIAQGRNTRVRLTLDSNLLREADLRLPVQNAYGDIVRLPTPEVGGFPTATTREAYRDALEDLLPPTAQLRPTLERMLPPVGASAMEASVQLWSTLFPDAEVVAATTPAAGGSPDEDGTNWTWVAAHHRKAMAELGVDARTAAAGQTMLAEAAGLELNTDLGVEIEALHELIDASSKRMKPLAADVGEQLLGALQRMRRELRLSVSAFARSAERSDRNRTALRGTRLHQLAQGLRPLDLPQELGLSTLAAAALFQLDIENPARYLTSPGAGASPDSPLLDT